MRVRDFAILSNFISVDYYSTVTYIKSLVTADKGEAGGCALINDIVAAL